MPTPSALPTYPVYCPLTVHANRALLLGGYSLPGQVQVVISSWLIMRWNVLEAKIVNNRGRPVRPIWVCNPSRVMVLC